MSDRQPPLEVFVGRAAELARMAQVVASVETGQPWLVTIEGEPGVGKTALARRSLAGTGSEGFRILSGRADQAEADLDFGLVNQWLRAAGADSPLVGPESGTAARSTTRCGPHRSWLRPRPSWPPAICPPAGPGHPADPGRAPEPDRTARPDGRAWPASRRPWP